jgi:hypothetical protein
LALTAEGALSPGPEGDLFVSVTANVPQTLFTDLRRVTETADLSFSIETRPGGPYAGLVWLTPTEVLLFLSGAFFASLVGEAAKDVYGELKRVVLGLRLVKVEYIGSTPGKQPWGESPGALTIATNVLGQPLRFVFGSSPDTWEAAFEALVEQIQQEREASGEGPLARGLAEVDPRRRWSIIARYDEHVGRWHLWSPPPLG